MRLTRKLIEQATYKGETFIDKNGYRQGTRYVLWDDVVSGFGLRITPSGHKSFILMYRRGRRKRLITIGPLGPLTLHQAREKASRLRLEVLEGGDPVVKRQSERQVLTVADLSERYLEQHAEPKKKTSSVTEDRRLLKKDILPALGQMAVTDVGEEDLARLHHSLRDKPFLANRILALLSSMFSMAERWNLRPDGSNPARRIERFRERRRERFLSMDEVARLGAALDGFEEDGSVPREAVGAIRLLLLTGCRRGEILTLEWDHVDFERKLLLLPDSKTGAKAVPLGSAAYELLRETPRLADSPYVFPGRHGRGHLKAIHRIWDQIRQRAGLPEVRLHDLRHSFASVGAGSGHGLPVLGKLLGHRHAVTTSRYAHLGDDPLRQAAEQISGEIQAALKRQRPQPEG